MRERGGGRGGGEALPSEIWIVIEIFSSSPSHSQVPTRSGAFRQLLVVVPSAALVVGGCSFPSRRHPLGE